MKIIDDNKQASTIQHIRVFFERFREIPAIVFVVATGLATITSVLLPYFHVNLGIAIIIIVCITLISLIAAGIYTSRRPTLSQRIIEARNHFYIGCRAFDNKDYEVALHEFELAYNKNPDDYYYASIYGRALLRNGKYPDAIRLFSHSHDIAPSKTGKLASIRNRGVAAMCVCDWGQAYRAFTDYIKINESSAIYRLLALTELAMGQKQEAYDYALKAVDLASKQSAPHATLSIVLAKYNKSNIDEARKEFNYALTKKHESGDALYALAQASVLFESESEALRKLKNAVRIDPKLSPRARLDPFLRKLRMDKDKFDQAIDISGNSSEVQTDEDDDIG
jgi:tetratricopeptide (TPR) repeat protein